MKVRFAYLMLDGNYLTNTIDNSAFDIMIYNVIFLQNYNKIKSNAVRN